MKDRARLARVVSQARWRARGACASLPVALVLMAGVGCGHESPVVPPPPPRDTTPPLVRVVYPPPDSVGLYDRDSNGLADLELGWSDSGGRVVPASLRVTCSPDCLPGLAADTNLAAGWRVVRLDSAGAVLEETVPFLLRGGERTLAVTVADTAGNIAPATHVTLSLLRGAYHGNIDLAGTPGCQPDRGVNFAFSPDGKKGLAPFHSCVAVFDPDGVVPAHFIYSVPNVGWAAEISVDTATGLAYIGGGGTPTAGFTVFDTRTEQVVGTKDVGAGMAGVAVDGERVFAGEACTNGRIYVYDKHSLAELGHIEVAAVSTTGSCPNSAAFAFASDHGTGWAAVVYAGLVQFDPAALTVVNYFDLDLGDPTNLGNAREIALVADHWLYLARVGDGLDLYQDNPWLRLVHVSSPRVFVTLDASRDQHWLVVNVAATVPYGGVPGSTPQVYEAPGGLSLWYEYPVRLGKGTDAVRFHPDGKRFYVMAEYSVNVYLLRPR